MERDPVSVIHDPRSYPLLYRCPGCGAYDWKGTKTDITVLARKKDRKPLAYPGDSLPGEEIGCATCGRRVVVVVGEPFVFEREARRGA